MMTAIKKVWNFLGSRDLSVFIFISGLTYILFLVIFSVVIPAWWVSNISKLLPFKVLYTFFFINLLICEIKWIPVVIRRCKRPEAPETEEDLQRFRHKLVVSGQWSVVSSLEKYLKRRWYRIQTSVHRLQTIDYRPQTEDCGRETKDSGLEPEVLSLKSPIPILLYAYRGRFSPIGNLLFHISFIFILAGIFISLFYRFDTKVLLMEGQDFKEAIQGVSFEVTGIRPEFWEDKLLFTDLVAGLRHDDVEDEARISKAVSVNRAKITIQGISYTPKYILRDLNGRELDVGFVNLNNFVSGTVDYFQIPGYPYKIYVSIYPDIHIKDGKVGTRSMNLMNPRYFIRVVRNKTIVYSGMPGPNDLARFDGFTLSFPEIKYNGTFRIVRDPGNPMIWIGFVLMGTGLAWRLLFFRREVAASVEGDEIYIHTNCDYYSNLFIKRCISVAEQRS